MPTKSQIVRDFHIVSGLLRTLSFESARFEISLGSRVVGLEPVIKCYCCTKKATRAANDGSDIWEYIATAI